MVESAEGAVTFFPTCLVELVAPAVGEAALRVLSRTGQSCQVARGATCCGQPAWNSGFVDEARRVARRSLRALRATAGPVVVPSGSCATMMHEYWPELFRGTPDELAAKDVAGRVREFSDHLARGVEDVEDGDDVEQPRTAGRGPAARVAYHDSCHMLRGLGIREQPRALLGDAGVEVAELPGGERCCGFGGLFSVKLEEISVAMADEKLDEVVDAGVPEVVGCDVSCLMHLDGRARRRGLDLRVRHLAEVLDERA